MGTINYIIQLKKVCCGYSNKEIINEASIGIEKGQLTILMGSNGSGKSTLIKTMAGLLPYKGSILLDNKQLHQYTPRHRAKKLAFLSQQHQAAFPFLVKEVVLTGCAGTIRFTPNASHHKLTIEVLERVGISHLINRHYTELSGGEQQLVMIARMLAQQAPLLLMDEPISHLDYPNQLRVLELAKSLVSEGKSIVMILHDPNQAFQFGDRFLFVHHKKVVRGSDLKPWESTVFNEIVDHKLQASYCGKQIVLLPKISNE